MSMRYYENDLELGSIYSAFDGALIGFKSTTETDNGETSVFLLYDIENNRCTIVYMPFVINGNGVFEKVENEATVHEKIYSFFDEYRRRTRGANSDKELWYNHYYKNFGIYANKIPHSECRFCGKIFIKSHTVSVITEDGYKEIEVCSNCYEHELSSCNICGSSFYKTDGEISRDGRMLCPKCKKRHFVLPYHRNYPKLEFYGKSDESNPQPYLGIELEVDEGGESNSEVEKILKVINANGMFAYCSHDGSLSNGFEIITQPATLTYHNSIKHIYKSVFETLLNDGYVSHDTTTCGLHIHFNRDFYADDEELYITRLLYIIDKFWDDVVRISRRNQRRMDRYTRKIDIPTESYIHRTNKTGNHDYHYYAVNLTNENTIEFRMFRGTLKVDTFLATLQFVNNCIIAAKTKSAEEIQQMKFEELITGRTLTSYWRKRKGVSDTEE